MKRGGRYWKEGTQLRGALIKLAQQLDKNQKKR